MRLIKLAQHAPQMMRVKPPQQQPAQQSADMYSSGISDALYQSISAQTDMNSSQFEKYFKASLIDIAKNNTNLLTGYLNNSRDDNARTQLANDLANKIARGIVLEGLSGIGEISGVISGKLVDYFLPGPVRAIMDITEYAGKLQGGERIPNANKVNVANLTKDIVTNVASKFKTKEYVKIKNQAYNWLNVNLHPGLIPDNFSNMIPLLKTYDFPDSVSSKLGPEGVYNLWQILKVLEGDKGLQNTQKKLIETI